MNPDVGQGQPASFNHRHADLQSAWGLVLALLVSQLPARSLLLLHDCASRFIADQLTFHISRRASATVGSSPVDRRCSWKIREPSSRDQENACGHRHSDPRQIRKRGAGTSGGGWCTQTSRAGRI